MQEINYSLRRIEKEDYLSYVYREKIGKQTFTMELFCIGCNETRKTIHWSVAMAISNKRKNYEKSFGLGAITGLSPFKTYSVAKRAFSRLVSNAIEEYYTYDNTVTVFWEDNRRRDAYYRVLSKCGYKFGMFDGEKCLVRTYPREK